MPKLLAVLRFGFICLLAGCLLVLLCSALGLWFGTPSHALLQLHIGAGCLFVLLALAHIVHRKKKWLKLKTQFSDAVFRNKYPAYCNLDRLYATFENVSVSQLAESLQLPLEPLLQALKQGKISVSNPDLTLREIVKANDEKLFSAITIVLQLKYAPDCTASSAP